MRRSPLTTTVLVAGALAVVAGCTSSGDGDGSAAPSGSSSASSGSSSGSSSAASTPSTAPSSDALRSTLLTPVDIGTGYETTGTGTTSDPLPCTSKRPPLFTQVPPQQKVQQSFLNGAQTVQVGQTVAEYDQDSGARRAYRAGVAGFDCTSGTIGGRTVRVAVRAGGRPAGSDVDEFRAWDFAAGPLKGTAVLVRIDDHVLALTFAAQGTAGNAVPVGGIVDKAVAKVAAHD